LKYFQLIYDNEFDESLNISKDLSSFSNLVSLCLQANYGRHLDRNKFQMFIYQQDFPSLRRLQLNGNVFDYTLQIPYTELKPNFPLLQHLDVGTLHINFALEILNKCPQLRSFSAKLCCDTTKDTIIPFNTYLPALKVLKLRGDTDFGNGFGTEFLEHFLPFCSNIHTFMFQIHCRNTWENLLKADWWSHVLVSNRKIKKITLNFKWSIRFSLYRWLDEVKCFELSPFFTSLNTSIRTKVDCDPMTRADIYVFIEN